jgi:HEAT repeat protein
MEGARPALEGLLTAEGPPVVEAALASLKSIGAEPSRDAIEKLAKSSQAKPRPRRMAAEVLGSFDPDAAVKTLLELSDRTAWEARSEAALGLATFAERDAAFFRTLKLLEDSNREVRASAFEALRSFRRKEAVEAALKLLAPLRGKDPALVERYLEWASGCRLGREKAAWDMWWRSARDSFQFPKQKPAEVPVP